MIDEGRDMDDMLGEITPMSVTAKDLSVIGSDSDDEQKHNSVNDTQLLIQPTMVL